MQAAEALAQLEVSQLSVQSLEASVRHSYKVTTELGTTHPRDVIIGASQHAEKPAHADAQWSLRELQEHHQRLQEVCLCACSQRCCASQSLRCAISRYKPIGELLGLTGAPYVRLRDRKS